MQWGNMEEGYCVNWGISFRIVQTGKRSFLLQRRDSERRTYWRTVGGYNTLEESKFAAELLGDANAMEV